MFAQEDSGMTASCTSPKITSANTESRNTAIMEGSSPRKRCVAVARASGTGVDRRRDKSSFARGLSAFCRFDKADFEHLDDS
jgi:hypothetical protein